MLPIAVQWVLAVMMLLLVGGRGVDRLNADPDNGLQYHPNSAGRRAWRVWGDASTYNLSCAATSLPKSVSFVLAMRIVHDRDSVNVSDIKRSTV